MKGRVMRNLIAVFTALTVIIISLIIYSQKLEKSLRKEVTVTLSEISDKSVKLVNSEVNTNFMFLASISSRLSKWIDIEDVQKYALSLSAEAEKFDFKKLGISLLDGTTYTSDGLILDLSNDRFYVEGLPTLLQNKAVVSNLKTDAGDGGKILCYAYPLLDGGGNVIGAVYSALDAESVNHLMSQSTFGGKGSTYIVEKNGTVISNSDRHLLTEEENFFDEFSKLTKDMNTLKAAMDKNESGYIKLQKNNEYLYYCPTGINGWYVLNVVPINVISSDFSEIMTMTYAFSCFIVLLAVVFFIIICTTEKRRLKSVEKLLYVDPLTGGMSYTKFMIEAKLSLVKNKNRNAAFIAFKFSNFSLIKEIRGHKVGDEILRNIHTYLEKIKFPDTIFARQSQDRFVALAYYSTKEALKERLRYLTEVVKNERKISDDKHPLKLNIGVYTVKKASENIQSMQNLATIAVNKLESCPDECIAFYEDSYKEKLIRDLCLEEEMVGAAKNNEFIPYFQPKYDTKSQKIVGAEALVRWIKPDGTVVPPGMFIPAAEQSGFVAEIDRIMYRKVCEFQKAVIDKGGVPIPISVNLSRAVLKNNKHFVEEYETILNEYKIPKDLIELEITESMLFENQEELKNLVDKLHCLGFRIVMDDFGVGYSSLSMLRTIPVDMMKLDKSFVDDYGDLKGKQIITAVIELATALNIPIVAEGVESEPQYQFLKLMNCQFIQGYYFARPMPQHDFEAVLADMTK